jgi:hypothetical protein
MNIYCIGWPVRGSSGQYAHFSAIDGWKSLREPCSECGWHWQVRSAPIIARWGPSSTDIADFTFDCAWGDNFAVTAKMVRLFARHGFDCEYLRIEYAKPKYKRHTVAFPYTGPLLKWVECRAIVPLDKTASRVECKSSCPACGDVRYPTRRKDIIIRRRDWSGQKMFRIDTNVWGKATFVTEEARDIILESGATNFFCDLAGEIVK